MMEKGNAAAGGPGGGAGARDAPTITVMGIKRKANIERAEEWYRGPNRT